MESGSLCVRMKADGVFGTAEGDTRIRGGFDLANHLVVAVWRAKKFPAKNYIDSVPASFAVSRRAKLR
jgi:hypothetical protein